MFDRKSDYALNKKDQEAIVCKSVSGVHIRLTRVDFASEEEFQRWKAWSDSDYHTMEKADHIYANHSRPLDSLAELALAVLSPEEELLEAHERQEQERLGRKLIEGLETCLTQAQRRRLWLYAVETLTESEIAKLEQVRQQSVSETLLTAKEKLKIFIEITL